MGRKKQRKNKSSSSCNNNEPKKTSPSSTTAAPVSKSGKEDPMIGGYCADDDDDAHRSRKSSEKEVPSVSSASAAAQLLPPQFYLAKWAILRLMGCMYMIVFVAAWYQNEGLLGEHGIQPAGQFMKRLHQMYDSPWKGFLRHPTLFWWIPLTDTTMNAFSLAGVMLSFLAVVFANSWLLQVALWLLYFSIVTIADGTSFYGYGWESQILETGFLCIFLCTLPQWDGSRMQWSFLERVDNVTQHLPPPTAVILWLFQWLIFRISTGAGLIKIRGSSCWTTKTCLHYHFETQPIPSPLSFAYHFAPAVVQRRMVDIDLVVQLYTAWFVLFPACTAQFLPRRVERIVRFLVRLGGFLQTGLMVGILLSGNFSVLNHLTIIPALACFDDECWPRFLQPKPVRYSDEQRKRSKDVDGDKENTVVSQSAAEVVRRVQPSLTRRVVDALLLCTILIMSRPVIENLLQRGSRRIQLMNASFNSFRLVNTYGAFGSVGEARYEAIIQISDDGEKWKELEFPCKPGDIYRRPCFCAPYHYRLDWNIWFIGFKPHQHYLRTRESWLFILLQKILEMDRANGRQLQRPWLDLLDPTSKEYLLSTYYQAKRAPKYIKVDMFRYQMAAPLWTILKKKVGMAWTSYSGKTTSENQQVAWWKRNFDEILIPPTSLKSFE